MVCAEVLPCSLVCLAKNNDTNLRSVWTSLSVPSKIKCQPVHAHIRNYPSVTLTSLGASAWRPYLGTFWLGASAWEPSNWDLEELQLGSFSLGALGLGQL